MDKQEAELNARKSVGAQIDEMYQALYSHDLYACESIGELIFSGFRQAWAGWEGRQEVEGGQAEVRRVAEADAKRYAEEL